MVRLTAGNQYLLELWRNGREERAVPRLSASMFVRDATIGKNVIVQFKAPDTSVRIAHAGSNVEKLIGMDLTGVIVSNIYSGAEQEELGDMQRAKFLHPIIIHSHSNATTLAGEMIQVELLQLPLIARTTKELIYVVGAFEWTNAHTTSNLGGDMKERTLLSRTTIDVAKLEPFDSEFTVPPVEDAKRLTPIAAAQIDNPRNDASIERVEL